MGQPVLGLVASAVVIAISLAYIALFDFATFVGWVSFVMLCLIPAQIVLVVLSPDPPFARRLRQPARGLALLGATIAVAAIVAPLALRLVGEGVSPPGPIPSQFAVIVVPTTFFLAIMFGGWPFTKLTRNGGVAALLALAASYVITYVVFRTFFNYDFLQGAPVYLASAPSGLHNGVTALVFYVTALAGMFLVLHFDLWPFTAAAPLMRQPLLGLLWLVVALASGALVMSVTGGMDKDPMWVLTRVTAPFIFGTIIVLNMLENSLFRTLRQPLKGVANVLAAAAIGVGLAQAYGKVDRLLVGMELPSGAPGYDFELWLVNALLSVTFPFLIVHAAYFGFWPLRRG